MSRWCDRITPMSQEINRRDFLKLSVLAFSSIGVMPLRRIGLEDIDTGTKKDVLVNPISKEKLLPYETARGIVSAENMPVWVFPVTEDYFYNYWQNKNDKTPASIQELKLSGVEMEFQNYYYSEDELTSKVSRYAILPYTTGQKGAIIGLLDEGRYGLDGKYLPTKTYYKEKNELGKEIDSLYSHSILAEFYPNKIINILEALSAVDDYQQKVGGFVKGKEYSMWEMLDIKNRPGYVIGKNSAQKLVMAGGVCITATNMCKLMAVMGVTPIEKWEHPSKYSSSPFAGEKLTPGLTDATVDSHGSEIFDLRFVAPDNGYIKLSIDIILNGKKVKSEYGDDAVGGPKADCSIISTYKWTKKNPGSQTQQFSKYRELYTKHRQGIEQIPVLVSERQWAKNDVMDKFVKSIAPEERGMRFESEFKNSSFLSGLLELRDLINLYDPDSKVGVGTYLRSTPWYLKQISRLKENNPQRDDFESSLRELDYSSNKWPSQPVQCVGGAILLAGLHDAECHLPQISGFDIRRAAQLVPDEVKSGKIDSMANGNVYVKAITTRQEVETGDLFVLPYTYVGHVGCVVGKKVINGETVLLYAAFNQTGDGRMNIFEVDGNNFDAVMGPAPLRKIVMR